MRLIITCCLLILIGTRLPAQMIVSGTVYDNSKKNFVEAARVNSTGGLFTTTDSVGHYSIFVHDNDSLYFTYNNKPTQKFPVNKIANNSEFDVSLRVAVESRYSYLKEVIVYARSYKQDSLENRKEYADVFEYSKPGLSTSITPGGAVGADLDGIINIFRFKRNKRLKNFQARLETEEQEKYVSYRFNRISIKRITGLDGKDIDSFMVWFRPSYEFVANADELKFNQYLLNASYQYKRIADPPAANKE